MQVTEATDAVLEAVTAIKPSLSIAASRLRTFFLPVFHSSARPVSENWNCPACNSCGLRNEPPLPGADRIRESRS